MRRREFVGTAAVTAVLAQGGVSTAQARERDDIDADRKPNAAIRQSICRWCYGKMDLKKLAENAARLHYQSIELLTPKDHQIVKQFGLTTAMLNGAGTIAKCFNRVENHPRCVKDLTAAIEYAAAEKLPNVICFSGNRDGMPDDEGLKNCAIGLKKIIGLAEKKGVTICMELLNSKVNHKDYMCDRTPWGVELCKSVGSPRFKLLYDIYHMQIMEGDVIATIQQYHEYIGHYHTGGVPGRAEIDETQELNYSAIMRAILATKYTGYVGQEFIPRRDPVKSLQQAFRICDV